MLRSAAPTLSSGSLAARRRSCSAGSAPHTIASCVAAGRQGQGRGRAALLRARPGKGSTPRCRRRLQPTEHAALAGRIDGTGSNASPGAPAQPRRSQTGLPAQLAASLTRPGAPVQPCRSQTGLPAQLLASLTGAARHVHAVGQRVVQRVPRHLQVCVRGRAGRPGAAGQAVSRQGLRGVQPGPAARAAKAWLPAGRRSTLESRCPQPLRAPSPLPAHRGSELPSCANTSTAPGSAVDAKKPRRASGSIT